MKAELTARSKSGSEIIALCSDQIHWSGIHPGCTNKQRISSSTEGCFMFGPHIFQPPAELFSKQVRKYADADKTILCLLPRQVLELFVSLWFLLKAGTM